MGDNYYIDARSCKRAGGQTTIKPIPMKLVIFIISLFSISKSYTQAYSFSQSQEVYIALEASTSINKDSIWSGFQAYTIPIGFPFSYMDSSFTTVSLEATGRLIFDDAHYYYADMFVVLGMQDKGGSSSLSPLSYQLSGTLGDQILKIEIQNATYNNDLNSTINYQIWLYESDGKIELHMGPNIIAHPESAFIRGPFSGVFHMTSFTPASFDYGYALIGASSSPSDTSFVGSEINDSEFILDSAPAELTVYSFSLNSSSNKSLNKDD